MDFQAYLGIAAILIGLAMSAREVARRQYPAAMMSVLISLQGLLLLLTSILPSGWAGRAVLIGTILIGLSIGIVGSRMYRTPVN